MASTAATGAGRCRAARIAPPGGCSSVATSRRSRSRCRVMVCAVTAQGTSGTATAWTSSGGSPTTSPTLRAWRSPRCARTRPGSLPACPWGLRRAADRREVSRPIGGHLRPLVDPHLTHMRQFIEEDPARLRRRSGRCLRSRCHRCCPTLAAATALRLWNSRSAARRQPRTAPRPACQGHRPHLRGVRGQPRVGVLGGARRRYVPLLRANAAEAVGRYGSSRLLRSTTVFAPRSCASRRFGSRHRSARPMKSAPSTTRRRRDEW